MKWSFSKKCYVLKIVTRKVCKLIQEKEFVKCFNLKGNTLVDIHNESGGKHSNLLKKAVTLFSIDKMYQKKKKKPFPLMMWGKKTNCMWEHLIIHTSFGNVYALDLSILTSIVLAADSVLYWTHPFVKLKAILYSHFQFSSLLKKKLQCGLSCESIEDSFDESTVKAYVKSDLENFFWVMGGWVGHGGIPPHSFWLFHWPLSLCKFICCYNKNNSLRC